MAQIDEGRQFQIGQLDPGLPGISRQAGGGATGVEVLDVALALAHVKGRPGRPQHPLHGKEGRDPHAEITFLVTREGVRTNDFDSRFQIHTTGRKVTIP